MESTSSRLQALACTDSESRIFTLISKYLKAGGTLASSSSLPKPANLLGYLRNVASLLAPTQDNRVAVALEEAIERVTSASDFGGYGIAFDASLTHGQEEDVIFLCSAFLQAIDSEARERDKPKPPTSRPNGRRGMTMTEKIFAAHETTRRGYVKPGDIVQVDVDWILASEMSWQGMEMVYDSVGRPGIFRNDRFWLAGDHRVEPELYNHPKVRKLMETSTRAQQDFKMTDFQGFNYTILHTEFVRERAQPGMLCIGADSHSCSAGAVSCLSIGMGATDVCMPLLTGQTWFAIPKTVNIRFTGKPPKAIGGKDTILHILGLFKRNTIAADRVVEFTGPGLQYLSCDARFAIANMCTEFGAVTGIFEADQRTAQFIGNRRLKKHRSNPLYFRADSDAEYDGTYEVDLSKVKSFVARHPSPDDVAPVNEVAGTELHGTFIGACTTAEEDLIIAALVLKAGLEIGLQPKPGRRVMVPGSKPVRYKLQKLGFLDIFAQAGFKVGVPGCSMCIGQGVDQAAPGEVWLSSQNRNFPNRMGRGSIANISSAATVAASSFSMTITDPQPLLDLIDTDDLRKYLSYQSESGEFTQPQSEQSDIQYSEPYGKPQDDEEGIKNCQAHEQVDSSPMRGNRLIEGKVMRLGDFIDTDAIIPSAFFAGATTNESLGQHCMEYFMPSFRSQVKAGQNVVVGGEGFGCGSSRDVAVNALLGAGVKCVIARSFSFIYARNQPNIGLLGIVMQDEEFYALAKDDAQIVVDTNRHEIMCGGKTFPFQLSDMEKSLIEAGGLTEAFKKFGNNVFSVLCKPKIRKPAEGAVIADIEAVNA